MSKTTVALAVGVGALVLVAYMNRKGSSSVPLDRAGSNPTNTAPPPPKGGKVTETDLLDAGVDLAKSLLNGWGAGRKPASAE